MYAVGYMARGYLGRRDGLCGYGLATVWFVRNPRYSRALVIEAMPEGTVDSTHLTSFEGRV